MTLTRHQQLDVRLVVGRAVDELTPDIREHGHELTVCLGADPVWIAGDAGRLGQIFQSLLRNAVTHTPPSGRLSVFVHHSCGWASVHITDSGLGMSREGLDRIFARPAHAPDQPQRSPGDLPIAEIRQLVQLHDGDLVAHSDGPGLGSRFVVKLPAWSSPSDRSGARDAARTHPGSPAPPIPANRPPSLTRW